MMVPNQVRLKDFSPAILITDTKRDRAIARDLGKAGFPAERIYKMSEVVGRYRSQYPNLGDYGEQVTRARYVNLALRDIALLAPNNETGRNYPDSMGGFKEKIR